MNLSVGKKLLIAFIIMIALVAILGLYTTLSLKGVNKDLGTLYDFHLKGIEHINGAQSALVSIGRSRSDMILARSPQESLEYAEDIRLLFTDFETSLEEADKTVVGENGEQVMAEIYSLWKVLKPNEEIAIEHIVDHSTAKAQYQGYENREIADKIELQIQELITLKDTDALKAYRQGDIQFRRTRAISLIFIAISIFVGISTSYYMHLIIAQPIAKISSTIQQVSDGNLAIEDVSIKNKDEIGQLADALNLMIHNLRSVVGNVLDASQQVAATSEELSASSDETTLATEEIANAMNELAEGSSQQARDASETSVVVGEMASNVDNIVNSVNSVSKLSENVSLSAANGIGESQKAIEKIQKIKQVTEESAGMVRVLGDESLKIGEIVEVIRAISDQTNLLALNAAIEAARAGEHGKGFTVVADEVRKLAEQSSSSALEIAELIDKIQSETKKVVHVMDIATNEVAEGVNAVNETGLFFTSITSEIDEITLGIQEVSRAISEIAQGSQSLDVNIEGIAAISQEAAASSEEVSAASEEQAASMVEIANASQELAELAQLLQENISIFRLT